MGLGGDHVTIPVVVPARAVLGAPAGSPIQQDHDDGGDVEQAREVVVWVVGGGQWTGRLCGALPQLESRRALWAVGGEAW